MLLQSRNYLSRHGENQQNLQLFGQEMNLSTWAICKLNMFLHGVFNADIRKGDTLGEPQHVEHGELMPFDRVIANPPFSLKNWGREAAEHDGYGRFRYGIPPKDAGDLAFVQHMIASLKQEGVMGVVVPHGSVPWWSRKGSVRASWKTTGGSSHWSPSGLFYGTGIPACTADHQQEQGGRKKGKVLFINAELDYQEGKNQNILETRTLRRLWDALMPTTKIKRFSRVVPIGGDSGERPQSEHPSLCRYLTTTRTF